MARNGSSGQRSRYNGAAGRFNDKNDELKSMYLPPVLKNPTLLERDLTRVYASFTKNMARAEAKHKEALAALGD